MKPTRINADTRAAILRRDAYTCRMCGAQPSRRRLRVGVLDGTADSHPYNLHALCATCAEGLAGIQLPARPTRIALLTQIRRATAADQRAVLEWLLQKFGMTAEKKSSDG